MKIYNLSLFCSLLTALLITFFNIVFFVFLFLLFVIYLILNIFSIYMNCLFFSRKNEIIFQRASFRERGSELFWIRMDIGLSFGQEVIYSCSHILVHNGIYLLFCHSLLTFKSWSTHIKKYIYIEQRVDRIKKEDTRPNCHESNVFMAGD